MAHHPMFYSGTPTTVKKQLLTSPLQDLWPRFKMWRQAGEAQQAKLDSFIAERCLILPADENCIDSVRISLPVQVVSKDRDRLKKLGFVLGKSLHKARKLYDGSLVDPDPGYELWQRAFDDCRVLLWPANDEHPGKCVIEVALSRLLGIPNQRLHELRQIDVQRAFEILMFETLPWTTARADFQDLWWAIVRLDLARDILASTQDFALAYAHTRWLRVRSDPIVMKNGICWRSNSESQKPHQLRLYDKGVQMRDAAGAHAVLDLVDVPAPGEVMRAERQFTGMVGLPALGKLLDGAQSGMRVRGRMLQIVSRESACSTEGIELSLTGLHRALAWELGLLGHGNVTATTKLDVLAGAYVRDPIARAGIERCWGRDSVRRIRKLAGKLRPAAMGLDLLQACYGSGAARMAIKPMRESSSLLFDTVSLHPGLPVRSRSDSPKPCAGRAELRYAASTPPSR